MSKKKSKSIKPDFKTPPPRSSYPAAPHIIGMDWIEVASAEPRTSAELLVAMGFTPRGYIGKHPLVAVGGLVIMLKKTTAAGSKQAGLIIQMTTDNITLKRQQLLALDLKPTVIKRQTRGDMAFLWKSPDGYTLRFTGPLRD